MVDFHWNWKRPRLSLFIRKVINKLSKKYRPVSLLPICGKIFECLLYHTMFDFISKNNLLSPNQSGLGQGDSYINQLLSINHEILRVFDIGLEAHGIFFDISEGFDKIWDGLIFKLRQNGICSEIFNILRDFLNDRNQRVVLNGQCVLG